MRRGRAALRCASLLLAAAVPWLGVPSRADDAHDRSAPGQAQPPVIVKLLRYDIAVDRDGKSTGTVHVELEPTNAAAAQRIMQQPIPFSESMTDLDILDAETVKPDGRKIPVADSAIFVQSAPGSSQYPMFNDQKQKVVVFPDVESGDTLDLTYRYREKQALIPDAFTAAIAFSRLVPYDDVEATVTVPRDLAVKVETHDLEMDRRVTDSTVTYHWHYSRPTPLAEDTSVLSPADRSPRLLVSSFADYDQFAHAYAAFLAPKETITPQIEAKADEITAGISAPREQAQAIYQWVSRHIRYVAVEIGKGAIVPHDADTVLSNGYGDCKDHVVLFSALLKAKGIDSAFVLINSGNSYTLPDTAILGAFNHAIAWLPQLDIYADTTSGVAPFGTLPFAEYGKPVVQVVASGPALAKTPLVQPGIATLSVETTARIDDEGRLVGQAVTTASGPFSVTLRAIGLAIQSMGPDQAAAGMLQNSHIPGSGSFVVPPPNELAPAYTVTSDFSVGPIEGILSGRRFAVQTPLPVAEVTGDFLMGPLFDTKITDADPTPCYSGHEEEDVSLTLPEGRSFLDPPADKTIRTAHLSYATRWSVAGRTLNLHREFTSRLDSALCTGQVRKETAKALLEIRNDYLNGAAVAPQMSAEQSQMVVAFKAAVEAEKRGDDEEALRQYTLAISAGDAQPNAPATALAYLARGAVNLKLRHYDAAIADYDQGVKRDPALSSAYATLADSLAAAREFARAERVWTSAIAANPASAEYYEGRGADRDNLGRHDEAQADFGKAIALGGTAENLAQYYVDRANSHWDSHDFAAALRDFADAIARDPSMDQAYAGRGRIELQNGQSDAALDDLTKAADLKPKNMYHALWVYIADVRLGKDAKAELARRSAAFDPAAWPAPLVKTLRGDMNADAITLPVHKEAWESQRDLCEEDFYLGEMALAAGDRDKALGLFRAARATNITEYLEYTAAGYEIERLTGGR